MNGRRGMINLIRAFFGEYDGSHEKPFSWGLYIEPAAPELYPDELKVYIMCVHLAYQLQSQLLLIEVCDAAG
jgi:hypothetical protein